MKQFILLSPVPVHSHQTTEIISSTITDSLGYIQKDRVPTSTITWKPQVSYSKKLNQGITFLPCAFGLCIQVSNRSTIACFDTATISSCHGTASRVVQLQFSNICSFSCISLELQHIQSLQAGREKTWIQTCKLSKERTAFTVLIP